MFDVSLRGMPQVSTTVNQSLHRIIFRQTSELWLAGGGVIDGASRDYGNTPVSVLRPGLLMGKVTSGGKYKPSFIGVTGAAYASGTSLTLGATTVTELLRRQGASGTFKLLGPPAASGVARQTTVTYSAASGTTATITALGANQVEQISFNVASTAGNLQLTVQKPDGTFATTGNAAWSATDATYLANINTALDTATGVAGSIVASAIPSVDPDLGIRLTYSNAATAYPSGAVRAQVALFPTSSTAATYTPVQAAADARFVTGSLVQPTDGSETVLTFIPEGTGVRTTDGDGNSMDQPFPKMPVWGVVTPSQLLPWPADTGIQAYLLAQLNAVGQYVFDTNF